VRQSTAFLLGVVMGSYFSSEAAAAGTDLKTVAVEPKPVAGAAAYNAPVAPLVKTGDAFPMTPWVQHGWKNATQMKDLFEGCSKVVIMMLPGGFTPT